jgi:hypothetical protein
LTYHGARYYASWIGRWTSCDPAGVIDSVNLFEAVRGNPTTLLDANGLSTKVPIEGIGLGMSEEGIVKAAAKQGWKVSGFKGFVDGVPTFEHGERMTDKEKEMQEARDLIESTFKYDGPAIGEPTEFQPDEDVLRVEFDGKSTLMHRSVWGMVQAKAPADVRVYAWGRPDEDDDGGLGEARMAHQQESLHSREDYQLVQRFLERALELLMTPSPLLGAATPPPSDAPPTQQPPPQQQLDLFSQRQLNPLPPGAEPYQLFLFPQEAYNRRAHYNPPSSGLSRWGLSYDHNRPLVMHWYLGQYAGDLAGYNRLPQERRAHARSWYTGGIVPLRTQYAQGRALQTWSVNARANWVLPRYAK